MGNEHSTSRSEEILAYWFGPIEGDGWTFDRSRLDLWFGKSEEVDEEIRRVFAEDVALASQGKLDHWTETPRGTMALLILLDQFTRHLFRGQPGAFAQDERAQKIVLEGLERGDDKALRPIERSFFYLPLEHAEDKELQALSVEFYEALAEGAPQEIKANYDSFLDYAVRHKVIIDRFGRFPHRNAFLGRESTEEEKRFLLEPGSSF